MNRNTQPRKRALSALLYGMAHAFDLGGTLAHSRGRFAGGPRADAELEGVPIPPESAEAGQQGRSGQGDTTHVDES